MKVSPGIKVLYEIPQLLERAVPPNQAKYGKIKNIEKTCRLLKEQLDLIRLRQKERLEQNFELVQITRTIREKNMLKLSEHTLYRIRRNLRQFQFCALNRSNYHSYFQHKQMKKTGSELFVVVIGASAGGLNAINEVLTQIPTDINTAVFVILHLSKTGLGDFLLPRLQQHTSYTCKIPADGEKIEQNHVYFGPTDEHLVIKDGHIILGKGPSENRWRPSIDVLFRSAAASYTEHVIGIILTGFLNDGTSGMLAVKRCGGTCLVQTPGEAEYPDMPFSVLNTMEVDYCVSLSEMGAIIRDTVLNKKIHGVKPPEDVIAEAEIAEKVAIGFDNVRPLGEQTTYTCPDCGGVLFNVAHDKVHRLRCYTGHVYTEKDLLIKQAENIEETLWIALRMMEERRDLMKRIGGNERTKGLNRLAAGHIQRSQELEHHIENLKKLLFAAKEDQPAF